MENQSDNTAPDPDGEKLEAAAALLTQRLAESQPDAESELDASELANLPDAEFEAKLAALGIETWRMSDLESYPVTPETPEEKAEAEAEIVRLGGDPSNCQSRTERRDVIRQLQPDRLALDHAAFTAPMTPEMAVHIKERDARERHEDNAHDNAELYRTVAALVAEDEANKLKSEAPVPKAPETLIERPTIRSIFSLKRHTKTDPSTLIGDRWLSRGGGAMLIGPTGIGKSVIGTQVSFSHALGRETFGLMPRGPLRSLIIQAENDEGDMSEIRDGVAEGLRLSDKEMGLIDERVSTVLVDEYVGESFIELLRELLEEFRPDMVHIDPALSYVGGNVSSQEVVGGFLRGGVTPALRKFACGALIFHHTNKPNFDQGRGTARAGDRAYAGTGSAEFANWARGVLSIENIGSHDMFKLVAGKRGKRLDWRNAEGRTVDERYIAHAEGGGIYWREPSDEEVAAKLAELGETGAGRKTSKKNDPAKLAEIIAMGGGFPMSHSDLKAAAIARGIAPGSFKNVLTAAIGSGLIVKGADGLYALPGQPHNGLRPSV